MKSLFTSSLVRSLALVGATGTAVASTAALVATGAASPAASSTAGVTTAASPAVAGRAVSAVTRASSLAAAANLGQLLVPAGATSGPASGPRIVVTSPARGTFTTQGATVVEGTVSDPSGIAVFTINGAPATVDPSGTFSVPLGLATGLNVIDVQATSGAHVTNKVSLSVLSGQFQPEGQAIGGGLVVRLNQGSLDAVSQVITSKLSGQMLVSAIMARSPLAHSSGWWGSSTLYCTAASFGDPVVSLHAEANALKVHVDVPGMRIDVHEVGSWNIPNVSGHVSCDHALLDADVSVAVQNGVVTTAVVNDSVSLQNFDWGINGLPGFLTGIFTGLVRGAVQDEVAKLVKSQVPPQVNKAIAGAEGTPLTQTILGSQATFNLAPSAISCDANGLTAVVDADCSLSPVAGYTPLPAPGSLVTGGAAPQNGGPGPDFFASVSEDLLNRAGYAVWKSGVARIRIDDSPSSPFHMPVGYPLDMGLLLTFLPELSGVAPSSDPLALTIEPLLPPVFKAAGAPDTLEADLGEIKLEFVDTVTNRSVIALALHVRAAATLTLNSQNTFDVHMSERPQIDASLVSAAAADINTIGIDNVCQLFAPTIVQVAGNQWSGFPLPSYPGLTPAATSIYQDGAQGTFVTAAANFSANGAPLPQPAPAASGNGATGAGSRTSTAGPGVASAILAASGKANLAHGQGPAAPTSAQLHAAVKAATTAALGSSRARPSGAVLAAVTGSTAGVALPGSQITATTGYVALVEDGLEVAVAPLLADYQARGVEVALVPLSQVVAQGRDRAEEIRNWLVAHCNDGVKRWLLLVGGPTAIPFRTCRPNGSVTPVVTDLYYGNLTGAWDSNGNGVWGELDDQPGFEAQLYVGRLPFDDAVSVSTAVQATLAARNPANKGSWSNRCLLVGATTIVPGDDPIGADTAKALGFDPDGWTTTTAFAPESFLKGDLVLDENTIVTQEQQDPAALLLTFSHGSTQGLASHPNAKTWRDVLRIPQLDLLPKDRPPVEIAVACNTADPTNGPCIGSIALQKGLAAWVGCTVVTDPRSGGGGWLLATLQLAKEVSSGKSLGESVADSMRDFVAQGLCATVGNPDATADLEQQGMSWICYGDPGLAVGPKAR